MRRRLLEPILRDPGACLDARAWDRRRGSTRAAYDACPRGDWMAWKAGVDRALIKAAAVRCARLVADATAGPPREVVRAVEAAEATLRGEPADEIDDAMYARLWEVVDVSGRHGRAASATLYPLLSIAGKYDGSLAM